MNGELLKTPIKVPENPFWDVFKRFGRDEMIAMAANVIGTAIVEQVTGNIGLSTKIREIVLSTAGPVIEKIGFFPAHFKDALELCYSTPVKDRDRLSKYFTRAIKDGSISLSEDILVHDPLYIMFMFVGMRLYPSTPAWLLATVSFVVAMFIVAVGEVGVNELRYLLKQLQLKRLGFESEKYYETRFFIDAKQDPNILLMHMAQQFNLPIKEVGNYRDVYFSHKFPRYSGRDAKLRLRQRTIEDRTVQTVQIVYRRTAESKSETCQFRFFPQEKHKYYFVLDQKMPKTLVEIDNDFVRPYLLNVQDSPSMKFVNFSRTIARNTPNGLFVSVDNIRDVRPFYLVEIKVYKDIKLLKEAMRFIMTQFPVTQITYGKEEIL